MDKFTGEIKTIYNCYHQSKEKDGTSYTSHDMEVEFGPLPDWLATQDESGPKILRITCGVDDYYAATARLSEDQAWDLWIALGRALCSLEKPNGPA